MSDTATTTTTEPKPAAPAAPQEPTVTTEPDLGDAGKRAIAAERARAEKAEKELKAFRDADEKRKTDEMSDLEKAQKAAKEATDQAQSATLSALRYRVALDKGLPANLADRLKGSTQEELEADADELADMVTTTPSGAPRRDPSQGARTTGASGKPEDQFADFLKDKLAGR
jgi:hypothetical protein